MGTTYHYTVEDEIIGEHTLGQSRLDYVTDALGSVIATVDQTLTVQSTARYKPYGAILAETGVQPKYGWVGSPGYRKTGFPHTDTYIRERHLSTVDGRWTTADPLWPLELVYIYAMANPTSIVDPSGLAACRNRPCNSTEIGHCTTICSKARLGYKSCYPLYDVDVFYGFGFEGVACECSCPTPPTDFGSALSLGDRLMLKKFKKCQYVRTGQVQPSTICLEGTHVTTTFTCGGKIVTVSVTCCPCTDSSGNTEAENCFPTVKP